MTTQKDFMRLAPDYDWPCDFIVVGVQIDFEDHLEASCFPSINHETGNRA